LVVEDAALLVDLDHGFARVVVDHAAHLVLLNRISLHELRVGWSLHGKVSLMSNSHGWVSKSTSSIHMSKSAWMEDLRKLVVIESSSPRLVVHVSLSISFLVHTEGALSLGHSVDALRIQSFLKRRIVSPESSP
jgi:hypothetical protein